MTPYKIALLYALIMPIVAAIFAIVVNPAATLVYIGCLIVWYVLYFMPYNQYAKTWRIKCLIRDYPNALKRAWRFSDEDN